MAKTNFFSVYLLQENYDQHNAIREDSRELFGDPIKAKNIPHDGAMYLYENEAKTPWWIDYCGVNIDIENSSRGAILFIPVNKRTFAFTFGSGFHHLDPSSYEYDFGLIVTMNSVEKDGLLSTDALTPVNAQRQRTQMPAPSEFSEFDFSGEKAVIKRMTGKVEKDIKKPFTQATGAESLRIGLNVSAKSLTKICRRLLTLYAKKDYAKNFPMLDNLRPEKDPKIISELKLKLCDKLAKRSSGVEIAIPDMIDYERVAGCYFLGIGKSKIYEKIVIENYFSYLREFKAILKTKADVQFLNHKIFLTDDLNENHTVLKQFPLFRCLICEIEMNKKIYHLSDGEWYCFEKKYVDNLRKDLNKYFTSTYLPEFNHRTEGEYNTFVAKNNAKYICLDTKSIAPKGSSAIEPCDLYSVENGKAVFHHIKRGTKSSQLSHLFNQGKNSIKLLKSEEESQKKIENLIHSQIGTNDENMYIEAIKNRPYKVVFGITTHKDLRNKAKNLPLFSCISLRDCIKELVIANVEIECTFIKEPK
jgi:uncharacterized protein (TIGR04141 family)